MTFPDLNPVTDVIRSIVVDSSSVENQTISDEIVEWYLSRFQLFFNDGCPTAANCYLDHLLNNSNCNTLTRSYIIDKFYDMQSAYDERRRHE